MYTTVNTLPPPRVPASDDGVIDASDIASDAIFAIIDYVNLNNGDFIKLYVDNDEAGDTTVSRNNNEPIIIKIPTEQLTDGTHLLSYDATDASGNKSKSQDLFVYVDSKNDIDKLAPPSILGGEDGCLTLDEINLHDGANIVIAPSPALAKYTGDDFYIYWNEYDSSGVPVPEGMGQWNGTISDTIISNGYIVTIARDKVLLATNGGAVIYYYVQTGAERVYSVEARVLIGNCENANNNISLISDKYEVLADGEDFASLTAKVVDDTGNAAATQNITWFSSTNKLKDNSTVTDANGASLNTLSGTTKGKATVFAMLNSGNSATAEITFINSIDRLPAPVFTQANNGVIQSSQIESDQGAKILVSYGSIQVNDVIKLTVTGKFADGTDDPQASVEQSHTVVADDVTHSGYTFTLPTNNALSVKNNGVLDAMYSVTNVQGTKNSVQAEGRIAMKNDISLSCWMTTGAPVYDRSTLKLSPSNKAKLLGVPGATISIGCSEDATIVESGSGEYETTLNQDGIAYFSVHSSVPGTVMINAFQVNAPNVSFSGAMQFENYKIGTSPFYAYAYTTGAVADGMMPCSLYIITEPNTALTEIRVWVKSDDAEIIGYSNPAIIPLNADHSVAVDISCPISGSIRAEVTLPESSGNRIDIDVIFVN